MPVNPQTGQPTAPTPYHNAPVPFNANKAAAQHAYSQAVAALNSQKTETLDYYGYNKKGRIDPRNVYGAYQMLGRAQGQQITDLTNAQVQGGLAGFGQRGDQGLARQQRNTALFAQGGDTRQLLKEFQDKMQAIRMGRREAKWTRSHSETSGTLQAIMNAISAGQFTPAAPVSY